MTAPAPDLAHFRARLQSLVQELTQAEEVSRQGAAVVQLDQTSVGRVSRVDALQAQAMNQETERRRKSQLQRARRALAKFDSGDYGYCESCDEPIAAARLEFDPAATLCIACAGEAEAS